MISFNNIPNTQRTPAAVVEVSNSRALKGLVQNPHRALIIGQMTAAGSAAKTALKLIIDENAAGGFFGNGSLLDRMCRAFKKNNPNTEVWAVALSEAGVATVAASVALSFTGAATGPGTVNLLIGGVQLQVAVASGWSGADITSAVGSAVNANSLICMKASTTAGASLMYLIAKNSGVPGNYLDARMNFYDGQYTPSGVTPAFTPSAATAIVAAMSGGTGSPLIADVWAVVDTMQFHHIIHPYTDATNLAAMEAELSNRFGPQVDLQGHAYVGLRGTLASCITTGLSRNSPFQTIIGANDSPTAPEEWAAALGGVGAYYLNIDPARPLQFITLQGVIPPTSVGGNRFNASERNILLYDGMATWNVDAGGNVYIERCITTYRTNALGVADPSYLDIETMFTLLEIRYQYKLRMANRFIIPRFKLADDGNAYPAGSMVVTPSIVKQEAIALFTQLRDAGLIENLDDFIANIVVERDAVDVNRVNVLLSPNLVNQFRILAGQVQFIL